MSDDDAAARPGNAGTGQPGVPARGTGTDDALPDPETVTRYLQWGALVVLALFALVAAASLYSNGTRIIELWVVEEYEPVVGAAFNLVVLLVAGLGISVLVRRLGGD